MSEPSRQTSRHIIAAGALAAIVIAGAGFALGRATTDAEPPPVPAEPVALATPEKSPSILPTVSPVLGRAELIAAVSAAADASAGGESLPNKIDQLAGRRFELRLPFGCGGEPTDPSGALRWDYDEAEEALRLRASPVRWNEADWLPAAGGAAESAVEAVEGFWIPRPWTSSETCPQIIKGGQPVAPEQTVGLAQLHTMASSRVGRRDGDAFEAVEKLAPGALDAGQGFRLRLSGQVEPAPDGRPIICRMDSAEARPICLVLVRLDQVAFESARSGTTIAVWDVAGQVSGRASDGSPNRSK